MGIEYIEYFLILPQMRSAPSAQKFRSKSQPASPQGHTLACMPISSFPVSTPCTLLASQFFSNSMVSALKASRASFRLSSSSVPSSTPGEGGKPPASPAAQGMLPHQGAPDSRPFFEMGSFSRLFPTQTAARGGLQRAGTRVLLALVRYRFSRIC